VWSAGPERWSLYLGTGLSGLARDGSAPEWLPHADVAEAFLGRAKHVAQSSRSWRRPHLAVWLSGDLARPFLMQPVEGMTSLSEAEALAGAQASGATGIQASSVWLEAVPQRWPSMVVAMPADCRRRILGSAKELGVHVASIRPWWARALQQAIAEPDHLDVLAAEDSDALILLVADANQWLSADAYIPKPPRQELASLLARRAFACGANVASARRACLKSPSESTGGDWLTAAIEAKGQSEL